MNGHEEPSTATPMYYYVEHVDTAGDVDNNISNGCLVMKSEGKLFSRITEKMHWLAQVAQPMRTVADSACDRQTMASSEGTSEWQRLVGYFPAQV